MFIKDLTPEMYLRLKKAALLHRRSMAKEALVAIERGLEDVVTRPLPPPVKPTIPLTQAWLTRAIHAGRSRL